MINGALQKRGGACGGTEHEVRGGELFPSFSAEETGWFREVAGVSIIAAGCLHSAVDTSPVGVQPSYYYRMSSFTELYKLLLKPLTFIRI